MENLTSLLKKNPELRDKYVAVGTKVADAVTKGLGKLMRHLLVVQDIDPGTQPGDRAYRQFTEQLGGLFGADLEPNEYTGLNNDEAWLQKHFAKAQGKFSNLSKDAFKKLTDLSLVSDKQEEPVSASTSTDPLQVSLSGGKTIQEVMESDKPVYTASDQEKIAQLASLSKAIKENKPDQTSGFLSNDSEPSTTQLIDALRTLKQYAEAFDESKEIVCTARTRTAVGSSRRFPAYVKVVKSFKNGLFRRVNDEKE